MVSRGEVHFVLLDPTVGRLRKLRPLDRVRLVRRLGRLSTAALQAVLIGLRKMFAP